MVSEEKTLPAFCWTTKCLNPCFGGIWSLRTRQSPITLDNGLNPCFGGIWSLRAPSGHRLKVQSRCLNPCFGGIWSLRMLGRLKMLNTKQVLILVLVGYGL